MTLSVPSFLAAGTRELIPPTSAVVFAVAALVPELPPLGADPQDTAASTAATAKPKRATRLGDLMALLLLHHWRQRCSGDGECARVRLTQAVTVQPWASAFPLSISGRGGFWG